MNILVDIGHPAHVHLTKNLIKELIKKGHHVIITAKTVPIIERLLKTESLDYILLGKKGKSIVSKILHQIKFDIKILWICIKHKINIGTGVSASITRISRLCKMSSINLDDDDDEVQSIMVNFSHPFTDIRLTPSAIIGHRKSKRALFYEGIHELAYLHPNRFTPNEKVIQEIGLSKKDRFFIMRFVTFNAYHDANHKGLSFEQKKKLIDLLSEYGRVIITSEYPIETEFEKYRLPIPPEKIHSLMYFSTLFIGDSQTMTSEAAIMGVPAFKCNTFAGILSVPNELENKYHLCYAYTPEDFDKLYNHIKELLQQPDFKKEWLFKKEQFIADKIDVTAFLVWFIENYPESAKIMKENPDYQFKFR
ncbi:hypothetical protein HW49_07110 [Porphyromonadaceae bacterium COT-184 OH4590]|nr:hypothetical protein HW49_07110 [Porphyromonadaceae bacterium COT-184 OH4590]